MTYNVDLVTGRVGRKEADVVRSSELTLPADLEQVVAVVVPHTHWDREWYAPFETMRFQLVQFLDELVEVLEQEPGLPAFLLDGQAVMLEDYLEVRRDQRDRVCALVAAGRLRPGPFYVQPDEFHTSGEALVRNLLVGVAVSREFGWVMREGYLPDTFGHVHQLPQVLQGFGIETFYAMRGFGEDVDESGSQFWWRAPDGSRVLVQWLTESYSNAAILTDDPVTMALHHGVLVGYDSLPELLDRMAARSPSGALLLLNGGDHLRVQSDLPRLVDALDAGVPEHLLLGGLEEFHGLVAARPLPDRVVDGELRYGARHDVFDGIGSTRTPMKALNERTEAHLTGVAERLDALATFIDGRSSADSLRYAWRELLKNYAHDSICGCSVDAVHEEMVLRFTKVGQVARAVSDHALARLATAAAPADEAGAVPIAAVNPSAFPRTGQVEVEVVFDLTTPLGQRRFGYTHADGNPPESYRLVDPQGRQVPFSVVAAAEVTVADALNRRKELLRDRISFLASDVPAMGTACYRLVPAPGPEPDVLGRDIGVQRAERALQNDVLRVEIAPDGTLAVTALATGRRFEGLLELLDDGDSGDEYGFGPLPSDRPISSRAVPWTVRPGPDPYSLTADAVLAVPRSLTADRAGRSADLVGLPVTLTVRLLPGADRVDVLVALDNVARDHRLRLRLPTGTGAGSVLAESAYGVIRRDREVPPSEDWQERPSGAFALRRFVALEDDTAGLQVLTEGLHEYSCPAGGRLDLTLLRAVGWLARLDHPLRPHKVGPQLQTPGAQCCGPNTFRLALRPFAAPGHAGALYRAAEEFSVPLQGWAVQGHRAAGAAGGGPLPLGLAVTPVDAVVTAVKTAEDRDGMIVRLFNSAPTPVTATVVPGFQVSAAERCSLEETAPEPLPVAADGTIKLPLAPHQITTVRLRPAGLRAGGAAR